MSPIKRNVSSAPNNSKSRLDSTRSNSSTSTSFTTSATSVTTTSNSNSSSGTSATRDKAPVRPVIAKYPKSNPVSRSGVRKGLVEKVTVSSSKNINEKSATTSATTTSATCKSDNKNDKQGANVKDKSTKSTNSHVATKPNAAKNKVTIASNQAIHTGIYSNEDTFHLYLYAFYYLLFIAQLDFFTFICSLDNSIKSKGFGDTGDTDDGGDTDEDANGGVSVLRACHNEEDSPPNFRSGTDSDRRVVSEEAFTFPKVHGVTLTAKSAANKSSSYNSNSSSSTSDNETHTTDDNQLFKNNLTNTLSSKSQSDAISRLCQPKKGIIKSINKPKASESRTKTMTTKVASEFVLDLPLSAVNKSTNEFKGNNSTINAYSKTKADDTLTRVGSENVHFNLLQSSDTASSLVSAPHNVSTSSPTSTPSRNSKWDETKHEGGSPSSSSRKPTGWDIDAQSQRGKLTTGPSLSPISKKKKDLTKENNCTNNDTNRPNGPSMADLLWAEKRSPQQRDQRVETLKKNSEKNISQSPIVKKHPFNGRAQSSGGNRVRHNNNNNNNDSTREKKASRGGPRGSRSPVPTSAPMRSKRILSQSLNGPPLCK
jgi:hypothetical protein